LESVLPYIDLNLELDNDLQEIVKLACAICNAPIALIAFLDEHTEYFKVKQGVDILTHPRTESFCTHTLEQNDIMIVPDAQQDARFAGNKVVTSDPGVRFYAGGPLTTAGGLNIGTLCVVDLKANNLDDTQQNMLKIIGRQAMKTIELRLRTITLEKSLKEIENQQEFINDASIRLRSFF
jgi:GAF domain-containing protein